MTLTQWHGFNGSLRYRHVSKYILDGSDPTVPKATGLDVLDLSTSKRIRHGLELDFAIDNVNNKRFYETQNYLESRVTPTSEAKFRVHGTPGYPIGFTLGLTLRLGQKK